MGVASDWVVLSASTLPAVAAQRLGGFWVSAGVKTNQNGTWKTRINADEHGNFSVFHLHLAQVQVSA